MALTAALLGFGRPAPLLTMIGVLAVLAGGWPIFKEASLNLAARRMTMELSMTIAIVAASALAELFTALVITLFVLVAEILEGLTVSRGRRALRDLLDVLPGTVSRRRAGSVEEVTIDELARGDAVLISPGGGASRWMAPW